MRHGEPWACPRTNGGVETLRKTSFLFNQRHLSSIRSVPGRLPIWARTPDRQIQSVRRGGQDDNHLDRFGRASHGNAHLPFPEETENISRRREVPRGSGKPDRATPLTL